MRCASRPIAAVLALALALPASAQTWTQLSRPDEGFEVEFSGPVKSRPTDVTPGIRRQVARAVTYMQEEADFVFAVGVQHNKRPLDLDRTVDASFDTLGCKERQAPEPLPLPAIRVRELRGTGCLGGEFSAILRHYTRDREVFQVLAIFRPAVLPQALRFLESFRLITRKISRTPPLATAPPGSG